MKKRIKSLKRKHAQVTDKMYNEGDWLEDLPPLKMTSAPWGYQYSVNIRDPLYNNIFITYLYTVNWIIHLGNELRYSFIILTFIAKTNKLLINLIHKCLKRIISFFLHSTQYLKLYHIRSNSYNSILFVRLRLSVQTPSMSSKV